MPFDFPFQTIHKTLRLPFLAPETVAAIRQLDEQWSRWDSLERRCTDANIPTEQQAAYARFLDNPDEANKRALFDTADRHVLSARNALLRRAYSDLRNRASTEAGKILLPLINAVMKAMCAEHDRRWAQAQPIHYNQHDNPVLVESRKAVDCALSIYNRALAASDGQGRDDRPLQLADALIDRSQQRKK